MSIFKRLFDSSDKNSENKKLDLEKLLSSDDINGSIIELDNYIGLLCSYGDEMDNLTEEQKLFYYNQCLEREINNGGFNQYFFNSSGDFANLTVQSLLTIGAKRTAAILQKAINQFPDKTTPWRRWDPNPRPLDCP
ncbi:MAG: DMP19 family protein [Bacteroidia bacterium]|nr:DMP19 family protein [Bacteroidia bacterium]